MAEDNITCGRKHPVYQLLNQITNKHGRWQEIYVAWKSAKGRTRRYMIYDSVIMKRQQICKTYANLHNVKFLGNKNQNRREEFPEPHS